MSLPLLSYCALALFAQRTRIPTTSRIINGLLCHLGLYSLLV